MRSLAEETVEMDGSHRRQHHRLGRRSRHSDRSYREPGVGGGESRNAVAAFDLNPEAHRRTRGKGDVQYRSISSDSSCGSRSLREENSFTSEFWQSSSKSASGMPIRALLDGEMSREGEIKRPSPSLIARLMGLDSLPPPQVTHRQQKELAGHLQRASSVRSQKRSHWTRTSGVEEFKDVFEVIEPSEVKHKNQSIPKGRHCSKRHEKELEFIRQKFMYAKRLSTNQSLQNSKEMSDTLEILDSNRDLFLKCLDEPNSLFARSYHHALNGFSSSPQASHITVLRSLKGTKFGCNETCSKSERKAEKFAYTQTHNLSSLQRNTEGRNSNSSKGHASSHSHELYQHHCLSKTDTCPHPSQIVILKPSTEKTQDTERTALLSRFRDNLHFSFRRHNRFWSSGVKELLGEERQQNKWFGDTKIAKYKTKDSKEIARKVSKQMRRIVSNSSKKVVLPRRSQHNRDGNSPFLSRTSTLKNCEARHITLQNINERNNSHPSSLYSSESFESRDTSEWKSEEWSMTQRPQEVALSGRGSSTLSEMLALSDTETPRASFDSTISHELSDGKSIIDEVLTTRGYPCGISQEDGWKEGCLNFPRSISLPSSLNVYGAPKLSSRHSVGGSDNCYMLKDVPSFGPDVAVHGNFKQRSSHRSRKWHSDKPQSCNFSGEGNKLPVGEIHLHIEKTRNIVHVDSHSEEQHVVALSDSTMTNGSVLVESSLLGDLVDANLPSVNNKEKFQQPPRNTDYLGADGNDRLLEVPCDLLAEYSVTSQCDEAECRSTVSSEEVEKLRPSFVPEPPSEEISSSTCFRKISEDLHGLRMQLQLLQLETGDTYREESEALLSDDDTGRENHSIRQLGDMELPSGDGAERGFLYLLDILAVSGIHGANQEKLFDACYMPECSVDRNLFDELEKKYSVLAEWSRYERRLLFDQINFILAEILAPWMDPHLWQKSMGTVHPMWVCDRLAEGLWQRVVRERKELTITDADSKVLDPKWLELAYIVDMVGEEIERMLKDDLFEELVSEFVSR